MASPYRFIDDLKRYYTEFTQEHGEPESIVMNEDQKSWYSNAVQTLKEDCPQEETFRGIEIE